MASPSPTESAKRAPYRVLSAYCPDSQCGTKLYFPAWDSSIECSNCGKRYEQKALQNVEQVTNPGVALTNIVKTMLTHTKPRKGTDSVQVMGLCNYQCKILSPLLSFYGMDRHTGRAKLLSDMGQGDTFDCGILGDRVFLIEPEHIEVVGYGRERTGSMNYLRETLTAINGDGDEQLLPIHADGDGHCLVHAVSRALIGRELFWHPLRENLKRHFTTNITRYRQLFREFIDADEWQTIIDECDPDYVPQDGESVGMRNIHIFGLANVLRRPIILVDSITGIQSLADYTGVFLPGLLSPKMCRGKDGQLNKPICLAWSSCGRNHYIALVGVKGRPLPALPAWMMPKVWGMAQDLLPKYVETRTDGSCAIGGSKCLQNSYILRLANAMEELFMQQHTVSTSLVADVFQYVYKTTGFVGSIKPSLVVELTQRAINEERLYRCLICDAITEWTYVADWLTPAGSLYKLAVKTHTRLQPNKLYSFPTQDLVCTYDCDKDQLVVDAARSKPSQCRWCQGTQLRRLRGDGGIIYENGDCTKTHTVTSRCQCGYKHYFDGHEYDNLPERIPVRLEWGGKVLTEDVAWFQYESDTTLNSNVYEIAQTLVLTHFPGEFGSERLVQSVVDTILRQTAKKGGTSPPPPPPLDTGDITRDDATDTSWRSDVASKMILTGRQSKSVHKEELTMSATERNIQTDIQINARLLQKRRTNERLQLHDGKGGSNDKNPSKPPPPHAQMPLTSESPDRCEVPSGGEKTRMAASPSMSGVAPPVVPSQAAASAVEPALKKVRVSTSDGRQLMLSLEPNITYSGLQTELSKQLEIPSDSIRIKCGFPPRELKPPLEGCDDEPLAIQNGDKVTVEILMASGMNSSTSPSTPWPIAHPSSQPSTSSSTPWPIAHPSSQPSGTSWTGFEENSKDVSAQNLLQELSHLHDIATDGLDSAINSLVLMCTLMGKDMWKYVQGMPHLFSVGGLFYEQVKRDLGLTDAKHCRLPVLPNKVFAYNSRDDRLELCLEPHGHYSVEPNIEHKVLSAGVLPTNHLVGSGGDQSIMGGATGKAVGTKCQQAHVPFSGQGHSMLSSSDNISMPHDLDMTPHGHKVSKLSHYSGSLPHPASIEEEDATTAMDTGPAAPPGGTFKRVGPGCTVLDTRDSGGVVHNNVAPDSFRELASEIRKIVARTERDLEEEEEGSRDEESDLTSPLDGAGCIAVKSRTTTQPDSRDVNETNQPTTSQPEPMDST